MSQNDNENDTTQTYRGLSTRGDVRLGKDERDELVRLRRENRELRMEKEILKKASAYFAKEMK